MQLTRNRVGAVSAVCGLAVIISIVLSSHQIRTTREGLEVIGNAEGCRRNPYTCPAGYLTDGIGNTHNIHPGTNKTDQQIADDWIKNIKSAESCVNKFANGELLNDNSFSAATSITFNVGCQTMKESSMFNLFRQGNINAACEQFPRWVYGGGKKLPGLVTRREKEKALCLKPVEKTQ